MLALFALVGVGLFLATRPTTSSHGLGKNPALPPASRPPQVYTTASGLRVLTRDGLNSALLRLLRYAPPTVAPIPTPAALGAPAIPVNTARVFKGKLGAPGVAPAKIEETVVGWIRDRLSEGQYIVIDPIYAMLPLAAGDTNLPPTLTLVAIMPAATQSGDRVPAAAQLTVVAGDPKLAPTSLGWVLFADDGHLAPLAATWPSSTNQFMATAA